MSWALISFCWVFVAISKSQCRLWLIGSFLFDPCRSWWKRNKAAALFSSSAETPRKACRGTWHRAARAFTFHFLLCVLPVSVSFSITLGWVFSKLKQSAQMQFCFCGHLSLTGVDLLHRFHTALLSPSSMPCELFSLWSPGYVLGLGRWEVEKWAHLSVYCNGWGKKLQNNAWFSCRTMKSRVFVDLRDPS